MRLVITFGEADYEKSDRRNVLAQRHGILDIGSFFRVKTEQFHM